MRICWARKDPVMHRLVPALVRADGPGLPGAWPRAGADRGDAEAGGERFKQTLDRGLRLLDEELEALPEGAALPGETAFKLYDTYGFPLDLTQDALREKGARSTPKGSTPPWPSRRPRRARPGPGSGEAADARSGSTLPRSRARPSFWATTPRPPRAVLALVKDGARGRCGEPGRKVQIVVNQTPFYAESGGQVGDTGFIAPRPAEARITDTKKVAGVFVHVAEVDEGEIAPGSPPSWRSTMRAAARSAPTTRRRTCCTRRCAARSAIMWRSAAR
jgi:alanyl-tRNA synthetase